MHNRGGAVCIWYMYSHTKTCLYLCTCSCSVPSVQYLALLSKPVRVHICMRLHTLNRRVCVL